jgi:hypothetical protein
MYIELELSEKLVDIRTKEIVGFIVANTTNKCALTSSKIKELNLSFADYLETAEVPEKQVISYNGRYADVSNALLFMPDYEDTPYEESDNKVILYGYVFLNRQILPLDNEIALKNTIKDMEKA